MDLCSTFVTAPTRRLIEYISNTTNPHNNVTVTPPNSPLSAASFIFSTKLERRNLDQDDLNFVPISEFIKHTNSNTFRAVYQINTPKAKLATGKFRRLRNWRTIPKQAVESDVGTKFSGAGKSASMSSPPQTC